MALSFGGKNFDPRGYWTLPKKIKPKPVAAPAVAPLATAARPRDAASLLPEGNTSAPPDETWKDQTYFDTQAGVSRNLDNLRGYLINTGMATGADYGIDYEGDPVTGAKNFRIADNVDVTNPFSRAALLKQSYQNANRAISNGAGGSQLYSGARQNALNETGRQNLQNQDALIKDFAGRFGGLYQTWLEGQNAASQQGIDAQTAAQGRHQNDPVAVPAPSSSAGAAFTPAAVAALTKPPVAKPVVVPVTVAKAQKARKAR